MQFCVSCEVCPFPGLLGVLLRWVRALEGTIFVREFFQLVKNLNFCAKPLLGVASIILLLRRTPGGAGLAEPECAGVAARWVDPRPLTFCRVRPDADVGGGGSAEVQSHLGPRSGPAPPGGRGTGVCLGRRFIGEVAVGTGSVGRPALSCCPESSGATRPVR